MPHDLDALAMESLELAARPSLLRPAHGLTPATLIPLASAAALVAGLGVLLADTVAVVESTVTIVAAVVGAALVIELISRLSLTPLGLRPRSDRRDALLLALVATALVLTCRLSGAAHSPLVALPLAVVAFTGAVLPPRHAAAVAGVGAILLASLYISASAPRQWAQAGGMAATAIAFGALASLILRGAALRFRDRAAVDTELRLQRLMDDARTYRLTGARDDQAAEQKRKIAAAMAVRESVSQMVEVAARALRPHSTILFLLNDQGDTLQVRELRTEADSVITEPLPAARGVLGSVVSQRRAVNLRELQPGFEGITYYAPPASPSCFLGVPVLEGEHLRGVLAVDRVDPDPFTPQDEALLTALAREVTRAAEVERLFALMDSDRRSQEALLGLVETLNSVLSLDAVLDALIQGVLEITGCELAAVVLVEESGLSAVRARGPAAPDDLEGRQLEDSGCLVASAIRTQAALPARCDLAAGRSKTVLFGADCDPAGLRRAKVLPLVHLDEAIGAVVVASPRTSALADDALRLLHVATGYGAIALVNGRLYAEMERMATRDGLTGLFNHRAFQEQLERAVARSSRNGQRLSLMLCDIDHFKQVNDTYGHPAGDEVLRRVAAVLDQEARRTDAVARYGGEEFAVIMEGTDPTGAVQLAERIRCAVADAAVTTERGTIKVTLSAGLATYPMDAEDRAQLIKLTDGALYDAKHGGRNRTVHIRGVKGRA